jgi:PiT family inorganic phosphate transporter
VWTDTAAIPLWVKLSCAIAIASGTFTGGWRIIRTMGKGLVEIAPPQGFAAESSSATVILISSQLGFALSTTHVATGSILGTGIGRPGAKVRWNVAGRMGIAWLITLPLSGSVGALCWWLGHLIGDLAGGLSVFGLVVAAAVYMFLHSRRNKVGQHNVTAEWEDEEVTGEIGIPAAEELAEAAEA